MAAINYDAIAQELKRGLVDPDVAGPIDCLALDKPMALKEFFTLGIGGPRQTGKTKWMIESLIRDPLSRLVVLNLSLQEAAVNYLSMYASLDENTQDGKKVSDSIWIPGTGWVPIHPEAAVMIRQNPNVIEEAKCRIITAHMLRDMISKEKVSKDDIRQIFIDHRIQTFHLIRHSKYYTWLAKKSDNYVLTWLID
jgi:hypothetical protein